MKYKTFKEWNKCGFFVIKGERSHKRNKRGECVFSEMQVTELYLDIPDIYYDCLPGNPMDYGHG